MVIVPLLVIGPPLLVRPVPPDTSMLVTVPLPVPGNVCVPEKTISPVIVPPALGSAALARSYAAFTDAGVAALVVLVLLVESSS